MHPNPECIYEKDGVMMSEDEEDCLEEYKLKGLVKESASFECTSPDHNKISPAIHVDTCITNPVNHYKCEYNVTVIPEGVVVNIQATRCDGKIECWNGEDEDRCGFNTFLTFGTGNLPNFY